jgi:hypothetical protein
MGKKQASNIFNYDFGWDEPTQGKSKKKVKDECCEKYKKKGEKKCKSCPNRVK